MEHGAINPKFVRFDEIIWPNLGANEGVHAMAATGPYAAYMTQYQNADIRNGMFVYAYKKVTLETKFSK